MASLFKEYMMKNKARRFAEGGLDTIDGSTPDDYTSDEKTNARIAKDMYSEEAPSQTFKQAFAAHRKAGDKTFEWNGKKYTTELAKPKASPPSAAKASTASSTEKPAVKGYKVFTPPTPSGPKKMPNGNFIPGFKKGGAVKKMASGGVTRGDGIAQRGKTRGKFI